MQGNSKQIFPYATCGFGEPDRYNYTSIIFHVEQTRAIWGTHNVLTRCNRHTQFFATWPSVVDYKQE